MTKTATVERVANGFVVSAPGGRWVATDSEMLAEVLAYEDELWPPARIDLTPEGTAHLEALKANGSVVPGDAIEDAGRDAAREALRRQVEEACANGEHEFANAESFVCLRCKKDLRRDASAWGSGEVVKPAPAPEVTRTPLADPDGTEYPPVEQKGANHFLVQCPHHGEQRLERRGASWVCPKLVNRADCPTRIPRDAMSRAVRPAA